MVLAFSLWSVVIESKYRYRQASSWLSMKGFLKYSEPYIGAREAQSDPSSVFTRLVLSDELFSKQHRTQQEIYGSRLRFIKVSHHRLYYTTELKKIFLPAKLQGWLKPIWPTFVSDPVIVCLNLDYISLKLSLLRFLFMVLFLVRSKVHWTTK